MEVSTRKKKKAIRETIEERKTEFGIVTAVSARVGT
jgi:hypothetical protein